MTKKESITRIRIVMGLLLLFAFLLLAKLYFVQIVHGQNFSDRADRQYVRNADDLFDRGNIFFQDKNGTPIGAATQKTGFVLTINPKLLIDADAAYTKLNEIVPINKEDFMMRASKKDDPYEEILHELPEEVALAIEELDIEGVRVYKEKWRYYPGGSLASHVLGVMGYKDNELAGRYGVERFWDDTLKRNDGDLYINFFAEVFGGLKKTLSSEGGSQSGSVYLTVEPTVQAELEKVLRGIEGKWSSRQVAGIVMEPQTGRIVAMAALPSFDPNDLSAINDVSVLSNPLVENVYEMGSIIKPLTVAAGLDANVITPATTYDDTGSIQVGDRTISNYDGKARGVVSMQEVLNQSLNTGVSFIVRKLGNSRFADYMRRFGLGERAAVDLPNESIGLIDNLKSPRDVEYATASFGQGIATSPIATVRALGALANSGKLVTPHVSEKVSYELGYSKNISYEEGRQVISQEASEEVSRMLVKVVDDALAGGIHSLPRYSVAAKTGTAQIAAPDGGYYDDRFLHSFFGYFPAYDPEYIVFLLNVEPYGARYASETLTIPFMDMTKFLINYYEIAPDR